MKHRSSGQPRIAEIDGLRGVLALVVLGGHALLSNWIPWFWGSMEVFFCISGFLITRVLLANEFQARFLRNYLIRRALRIWPMYFVTLFICIAAAAWAEAAQSSSWIRWKPDTLDLLLPFFFLQNTGHYLGIESFESVPYFDHSWSVAVEEQFYLLAPICVLLLRNRSVPFITVCFGASLALPMLLSAAGLHHWLLLSRLYGFVLGGLLAVIETLNWRGRIADKFRWLWIWPVGGLLPFVAGLVGDLSSVGGLPRGLIVALLNPYFNFALLGFCILGAIIFRDCSSGAWNPLRWPSLVHLGRISYSTYLVHVPIVFGVIPSMRQFYAGSDVLYGLLGTGLSLVVAHFAFVYIEAPFMTMKRAFGYQVECPADAGDAKHWAKSAAF